MLPTDEGRYYGVPREWSVARTGPNNLVTFVCSFDLTHWQQGDEFVDCAADEMDITGYFYLVKTDGQLNTFAIDALKHALGWDGRSFQSLNDGQWGAVTVQLTLGIEEYNNKRKMKLQFINHVNDTAGGVKKADPQEIKTLDQQFGSMLRAVAGPAKGATAAKPANGKAAAKAPVNPLATAAWKAFSAKTTALDKSGRESAWKESLDQYFGAGCVATELSDAQWKKFATDLPRWDIANGWPMGMRHKEPVASPLSEEPQFEESDIPFAPAQ